MLEGLVQGWKRFLAPRPSESDLEGQIQWAVDQRLGAADYQSLPAVSRARSLIVSLVAELDPVAWANGYPMDEQPAIVTRPQPSSTRAAFIGSLAGELFDRSNAFVWLPMTGHNAAGFPDVGVVVPFDQVNVQWDDTGLFRRYWWRERERFIGRDWLHIELPGRRPEELLVPSKFDVNAAALARILAAELYAGDWFTNGGVPSIVLKYAGVITGDDAGKAKAQWVSNHLDHSPGVMGQGWDFAEVGGNPESSQLNDTRRAGVLEVARIWGIVPAELLLAEMGGSSLTYQNIERMLRTFMKVTGQPEYLDPIEGGLSDLVPRTQAVRFDLGELYRLDEAERVTTEASAIAAGIYTLPEVRRGRGLPVTDAPRIPAELAPTRPAPEEVPIG